MFNKFYKIENGQIVATIKRGGSYENTTFGKDMPDEIYINEFGFYGEINESPDVGEYQRRGEQKQIINHENQTVINTYEVIDMTQEEIEAIDNQKAQAARKEMMLSGAPYMLNNVEYQVSFTSDDANGLMQVGKAFELGVASTVVKFENGTNMPVSPAEFGDFAVWFVAERNKFFVD